MKGKTFKAACLGNVLVDVLVKPVDRLPPPGGLLPVEKVEMAMGGCASNTAIALSRMGVAASLWGRLGRDFFGKFALENLAKDSVDTSGMVLDPKVSTSATVVLVDSEGQRSFLHSMAANDEIQLRDIRFSRFSKLNHLHVGGYFLFPKLDGAPMAKILRGAQRQGVSTSLDTAWDLKGRWMKALEPCLPYLDYFMPSERESRMLVGPCAPKEAAKRFLKLGANHVVLKLGEKGSRLYTKEGAEIRSPAFSAKSVDTTGAGDCFCAGFIKGLSLGWSLGECLRLANAAGACAVEALGGTAGIRSFSQVRNRK